jgi:tRNA(fMet)-specific endonuclease VapC
LIYLLDTNAISDLMRANPRVEDWISGLDPSDRVVTCAIVVGEILFGIIRLPAAKRRSELEETGHRFLAAFRCEPIPVRAAGFYANLKVTRRQSGLNLDENDLWVAATALALGAGLVSRDNDFAAITGLSVVALA